MFGNIKEIILEINKLIRAYEILTKVYQEVVYGNEAISSELIEEIVIFFRFDDSE